MRKELVFYSLLDFYPKKEKIKEEYEKLELDEKIQYKMYVYSLPFEEEYIKDLMWEYLNGWEEAIFDLAKKHRQKKEKFEKRKLNEKPFYYDDDIYKYM